MSGCSDDFAYEHLGIYSWTTEFWDVIHAATGNRGNNLRWYLGHSVDEHLAVAKWADIHAPHTYNDWVEYMHPQLGPVELGGPDDFHLFTNPPLHLLRDEVAPHAEFALYQAMLSPKLEILFLSAVRIGCYGNGRDSVWHVKVGVANTGFLPTNVTAHALKIKATLPVYVEIGNSAGGGFICMADGHSPSRVTCGQLSGRLSTRVEWSGSDGTPDRALVQWMVVVGGDTESSVTVVASHPRAGTAKADLKLNHHLPSVL